MRYNVVKIIEAMFEGRGAFSTGLLLFLQDAPSDS
jgi:hypothetical protein